MKQIFSVMLLFFCYTLFSQSNQIKFSKPHTPDTLGIRCYLEINTDSTKELIPIDTVFSDTIYLLRTDKYEEKVIRKIDFSWYDSGSSLMKYSKGYLIQQYQVYINELTGQEHLVWINDYIRFGKRKVAYFTKDTQIRDIIYRSFINKSKSLFRQPLNYIIDVY